MKVFGGFFLTAAVLWIFWALLGKTDCDQVHRFAAPVNGTSLLVRSLSSNWVESDTKIEMLYWSVVSRETTEQLVARTFYSKTLTCGWGKK